jgi:hypothetical protein
MWLLDSRHCYRLLLICERTVDSNFQATLLQSNEGPAAASHMGDTQWAAESLEGELTVAWSFWPPYVR